MLVGRPNIFRQWIKSEDGATILEFALVAPVFFLLLMAIIEFGLIMFTSVALESAVMQASRDASIGKCATPPCGHGDRVSYLQNRIVQKTQGLIGSDQVVVTAKRVVDSGELPVPDVCLKDGKATVGGACNGCPPGGQCTYEETNGINGYQGDAGSLALGAAGELVEIRVMYPWMVQVPIMRRFFGTNGIMMISSSTVIKNEPFSN